MSHLQQAFDQVITDAVRAERWYVVLVEYVPYYGGPEEGGWYGNDMIVHAYREYISEALAEEAAAAVRKVAEELSKDAQRSYGEQCVRECDWLEERGLEADWLPEPDGPAEYQVLVTSSVPENRMGERQYS